MPRGLWKRGKDDDPARASAVREDAAELLRRARDWELSPTRWSVLDEILDSISAAETAGDLKQLAEATGDLRLLDPLRLTPWDRRHRTPRSRRRRPSAPGNVSTSSCTGCRAARQGGTGDQGGRPGVRRAPLRSVGRAARRRGRARAADGLAGVPQAVQHERAGTGHLVAGRSAHGVRGIRGSGRRGADTRGATASHARTAGRPPRPPRRTEPVRVVRGASRHRGSRAVDLVA